jgi:aspartyl-tRNA(Asn)/glutamyl-tRNA(Gln) amidotransferase subunit B
MSKYIPVIGMEVHVELNTKSKMFCSCSLAVDEREANTNICEICLAHPGTLPVPNSAAIVSTVLIGRALGCSIRELSKFDRKHYFYPDLPKGYQISQYDEPIAEHGFLDLHFVLEENIRQEARIGITRAHLEEDTAKLYHDAEGTTLADFNRSGTPLVEIVTDPDLHSALEARVYCQELQLILRTLGVSDADMEHGHMRCEANISVQEEGKFEIVDGLVRPLNGAKLNNKVELKNLNSFRAVERGIAYEIVRQSALLDEGESWPQETRGWNEESEETYSQRIKESAKDYRYFPEPDIPPFSPLLIAGDIHIPELPIQKRKRFYDEYGFSYADAKFLTDDNSWANFAEEVMSELSEWLEDLSSENKNKMARLASSWMINKLKAILNERNLDIEDLRVSPENFAEFIALVSAGRINSTNAQKLLLDMIDSGVDIDPTHIMEEKGYGQVSDEAMLVSVVEDVIKNNPVQVEQFKSGKDPVIKFLIGMCMKATEGSADPAIIEKLLREKLV